MRSNVFWSLCAAVFVTFATQTSASTIVIDEDFSYPDGDLTAQAAWSAHSGAGSTPIQVSGGAAVLEHGGGSREDVNTPFAEVTAGILTATFDVIVNDTEIVGGDDEYFAHFRSDDNFIFPARVYVAPATGTGDYTFGISSTSGGVENVLSTDFTLGAAVELVLEYNTLTGASTLTAGGSSASGDAGTAAPSAINTFGLRQSNSASDEQIIVDNLTVAVQAIPEPTTALLVLLGASFASAARTRSRLG